MITLQNKIHRQADILLQERGEEWVLMNLKTGKQLGLNKVGTKILEMTEKPIRVDDLCAQLSEEYSVTIQQCEHDVLKFLERLQHQALIKVY